jgi:pimeloyl-ACP methyl ester carboxylesterase
MRHASWCVALLALAAHLPGQQPDIGAAPGRMIDVAGRKMHLLCSGAGSPTVVLEAGASAFAIDWTLVQTEVARTNRVCSYDRAGSGWSEPSSNSTATSAAQDLHALLNAAGERPPFVMVGASLGGILVRLYQADYPGDVVGLVLVDPSSEDRLFTYYQGQAVTIASLTAEQYRSVLPQHAVRVPRRQAQTGSPFDRLPPSLYALRIKLDERLIASVPDTVSAEVIAISAETERARLARLLALRSRVQYPLGDIPTVVLTRGLDTNAELQATHAKLARLSTNSRHRVIAGAGHEIHLFAPAAVIQAIAEVNSAATTHERLAKNAPPR